MVHRQSGAHQVGAHLQKTSQKVLVNRLVYISINPGMSSAYAVLHKLFLLFQLEP
jgi:hypothetical protein